jgi:hypothetical protein
MSKLTGARQRSTKVSVLTNWSRTSTYVDVHMYRHAAPEARARAELGCTDRAGSASDVSGCSVLVDCSFHEGIGPVEVVPHLLNSSFLFRSLPPPILRVIRPSLPEAPSLSSIPFLGPLCHSLTLTLSLTDIYIYIDIHIDSHTDSQTQRESEMAGLFGAGQENVQDAGEVSQVRV